MPPTPTVYGLIDPRTGQLRYIGKTVGYLNTRVKGHVWEARMSARVNHRLQWLRGLDAAGLAPTVIVLAVATRDTVADMEVALIARARAAGRDLVNATAGGEGMAAPGPETRAKLRARQGYVLTDADRQRAGEARAASQRTPEAMARKAATYQAKLERRRKPADAPHGNAGRPKSPEHRARLAEATRQHLAEHGHPRAGTTASDETRARLRAAWERRKGAA